jgi:dihydrofolate reductase
MSKVFFAVAVSQDGYIAGPNGGPTNPLGDRGTELHEWMYPLRAFQSMMGNIGGVVNTDNSLLESIVDRVGANIIGKRMFDEGEHNWPENSPFHTPVFVLTHEKREPWVRVGGTTFYFTDEDITAVLEKARTAAGGKDVRITGGAHVIQQFIKAGLIDEFYLHLAPVTLGGGIPLFADLENEQENFSIQQMIISEKVIHHRYSVLKNTAANN